MERLTGDGPVALVSSDVPGIPPRSLERAFAALAGGDDVVLGPALDGGYWLIAMRGFHPAPFLSIPWSTPAVLATTLERCREARLRVHLLDSWRDVDTAADPEALAEGDLDSTAPRTARLPGELLAAGAVGRRGPGMRLESSELLLDSPWRSLVRDRLRTRDGTATSYAYLAARAPSSSSR